MLSSETASTECVTECYRRVAERTGRWRHYSWYWGDAIAVDGVLAGSKLAPAGGREAVVSQLAHWARTAPDSFDDVLAPGLAIADLVQAGELDRQARDRWLHSVDRLPALACGLPALEPHRLTFRFGFCIDALYHLPPALAACGIEDGDPERVRSATALMLRGVDLLTCSTGWAQWYDDAVVRNNAIAWSRGIGWALLGLLDLLDQLDRAEGFIPPSDVVRAEEHATAMLERLATTQLDDGNWAAVLGDELAPAETSTAAFFVAAALHRRRLPAWSPPADVLTRAESAVLASVSDDGVIDGVSADILPAWDITGYREFACEPSPWGQGAALRALAAMAAADQHR
jgi:rhamnogalacturonyl hydrolase YesR